MVGAYAFKEEKLDRNAFDQLKEALISKNVEKDSSDQSSTESKQTTESKNNTVKESSSTDSNKGSNKVDSSKSWLILTLSQHVPVPIYAFFANN